MDSKTVEALRRERLGYQRRGLTARAKQVTSLLEAYGVETAEDTTPVETASTKPPVRRKTTRTKTRSS